MAYMSKIRKSAHIPRERLRKTSEDLKIIPQAQHRQPATIKQNKKQQT